ncbi:MAG: hypothetical protein ACREFH_06505 [Stellaceae bacterium]
MAAFDTLKLARSLRDAGMPGAQAEATAGALAEAFTGEIAEKRDIEVLRRDIGAASEATGRDIEALRHDLEAASAASKRDLEAVAATAKHDLDIAVAMLTARLSFQQWQLGLIAALLVGVLLKLFLR